MADRSQTVPNKAHVLASVATIDDELLAQFIRHFRIRPVGDPRQLLTDVSTAFSQIPYENLSKIVRLADRGSIAAARETPQETIAGHIQAGTGGTCFSLTSALLQLVRSLGFQAEPILADRSYGPNTHCAMMVWIDTRPYLVDPGFLLVQPIPLEPLCERVITTSFNTVALVPQGEGRKLDLFTCEGDRRKYRLTFKVQPVDASEFLAAWDESYAWDMMQYPLLTKVDGQQQVYVRGSYRQVRTPSNILRGEIPADQLSQLIASEFKISPTIVHRALTILDRNKLPPRAPTLKKSR